MAMSSALPIPNSTARSPPLQSPILSGGSSGLLYRPSKSLPMLDTGMSTLNKMRARRRASGDTELCVYERVSGLGYSEEEDSDECDSDSEKDVDDLANMEMDQPEPEKNEEIELKKARTKAKGKGRAVDREKMSQKRREERRASLNARRPVITLKKDHGWQFSQTALFPQHLRDSYALCEVNNAARRTSAHLQQSRYGRGGDPDSEDDHRPVEVTEIRVTPQESRDILPS